MPFNALDFGMNVQEGIGQGIMRDPESGAFLAAASESMCCRWGVIGGSAGTLPRS